MRSASDRVDILGTGWAFPPAFHGHSRQVLTVSQVQDVEESLRILLATNPGERVMHPTYGCGLKRMVFEPLSVSLLTELRSLVEKAVLFFEPRITLEEVEVQAPEPLGGVLYLHLTYTIRSTNTRHNLVYPLYLEEGSNSGALGLP